MTDLYQDGSRSLQDRFDTRRLADRIEERLLHTRLSEEDRAFIEARDMFFLATADAQGKPSFELRAPSGCNTSHPQLEALGLGS